MIARPLSAYFRTAATAVINFVGDEFVTRIETDDGWYVEPPPTRSIMEAARQIRLWAGETYEVAVIEDVENADLSARGMHRQASPAERRRPRRVVAEVASRSREVRRNNTRKQKQGAA